MKTFCRLYKKSILAIVIIAALILGSAPQAVLAAGETILNVADWSATTTLANVSGRPTVLYDNGTYHMWHSNNSDMTLYYTTSTDPTSFALGTQATFPDATEVSSPAILLENGIFYMVKYGDLTSKVFSIYTSENGIDWVDAGVVYAGAGLEAFDDGWLKFDAPYLLKDGDTYKLYFQMKGSATGTPYYIFMAESAATTLAAIADVNDDIDFTLANGNQPVLSPGDVLGAENRLMHPMVVKEGSNYYMWYTGHGSYPTEGRVFFASSLDGINWVKGRGLEVINATESPMSAEPTVVNTGTGWHMWYLSNSARIKHVSATGPFQFSTIQAAINAASVGDTITVSAGTYVEDLTIDKALTLLGPNDAINPNSGVRVEEAVLLPATSNPDPDICEVMAYISASDVTVKGFTFNGDNPSLTSGVLINGADVDACEILAGYDGIGNIVIENNILKYSTYSGMEFYNYTNDAATAGNFIRYNLLEDIGETTYNWGIGVLVYNNFYADITDNVFNRVRTGIQTGNYYRANPGTTGSISNNDLNVWRLGIFHNMWYANASPITIADNTITAVSYPGATKWNGILLSSFQSPVSTVIRDNTITIPDVITYPAPGYAAGYNVWNVGADAAITIEGGIVNGGDYGVFVNNFEGYATNANSTSITIQGVISRNAKVAGIYVKDSPDNTNDATVHADILSSQIEGAATGILVEGSDATMTAHWNRIADITTAGLTNTTGTLVDATNNWWGCNEGPTHTSCASVSTLVDADPWLVLTLTADQTQLFAGGTINLLASLTHNSDDVDTSASGLVMDGIPVAFASTYGVLTPASAGLLDGSAAFTLSVPDPVKVASATVTASLDQGVASLSFDSGFTFIFLPIIFN